MDLWGKLLAMNTPHQPPLYRQDSNNTEDKFVITKV
jgi:hypothetical protein